MNLNHFFKKIKISKKRSKISPGSYSIVAEILRNTICIIFVPKVSRKSVSVMDIAKSLEILADRSRQKPNFTTTSNAEGAVVIAINDDSQTAASIQSKSSLELINILFTLQEERVHVRFS